MAKFRVFSDSDFDDVINISGLTPPAGFDGFEVFAAGGDDRVTASRFDDYISGDDGDDLLDGARGNDELHGGVGEDIIFGGRDNDEIYGGADSDYLEGNGNSDVLYGEGGNDTIYGDNKALSDSIGGSVQGDDQLFGGDGADTLYGQGGNDLLVGGRGDDTLSGGIGNDALDGQAGVDRIDGGRGSDTLTGGANSDFFIFKETETRQIEVSTATGQSGTLTVPVFDTITDFAVAGRADHDYLDLSALLDAETTFDGTTYQEARDEGYVRFVQQGVAGDANFGTTVVIDYNGKAADLTPDVAVVFLQGVAETQLNASHFIV